MQVKEAAPTPQKKTLYIIITDDNARSTTIVDRGRLCVGFANKDFSDYSLNLKPGREELPIAIRGCKSANDRFTISST